jgi:phosphoserine phosphatase
MGDYCDHKIKKSLLDNVCDGKLGAKVVPPASDGIGFNGQGSGNADAGLGSAVQMPLCVDLDGTLIRSDVTINAIEKYCAAGSFCNLFRIVLWFLRGRAHLKRMLAHNVGLNARALDYNENFLDFIKKKRKAGHKIFLATACDEIYANKIADFLGIFDGVFASNGIINLKAKAKADALSLIFGEKNFIYAGNSADDVYVWEKSAVCIMVNPTKSALKKMKNIQYYLFSEEYRIVT